VFSTAFAARDLRCGGGPHEVRRGGALRRCAIVQNGDVGAARGCAATAARRVRRRTPATACSLAR